MIDYEYTQVNRLDEPHRYMYTKFEGNDFLKSYFKNRRNNIERFLANCNSVENAELNSELILAAITQLEKFLDEVSSRTGEDWQSLFNWQGIKLDTKVQANSKIFKKMMDDFGALNIDNVVNTRELLNSVLSCLLTGVHGDKTKEWLDRLVQRFEVSKKLYESYPPGFRKGSGSTKIVSLYWLFSISLCLYYITTGSIKYLSTQLKISDLLCSLPENQLTGQISSQGMLMLLLTEIQCIKLLTRNIKGEEELAFK